MGFFRSLFRTEIGKIFLCDVAYDDVELMVAFSRESSLVSALR